jgi:hypothetical protein
MSKFIIVEQCDKYEECPGTWYFVRQTSGCVEWTDRKDQATMFDTEEAAKSVQATMWSDVTIERVD